MNPLFLELQLKEKHREMLKEAELQRLLAAYNALNPGWRERMQVTLGDFLIRLGKKIKHRYTHQLLAENDLCRE